MHSRYTSNNYTSNNITTSNFLVYSITYIDAQCELDRV